ncbi:MAG: DUF6911 family protein [Janthinobacterium lividum]
MNLSWTINISFPSFGGHTHYPTWSLVEEKIKTVLLTQGTVDLETEVGESKYRRQLQVQADNGNFLLMLGVETENDWVVRTYDHPEVGLSEETIDILGDVWLRRKICLDKEVVTNIFKEFFTTGDVSEKYLN